MKCPFRKKTAYVRGQQLGYLAIEEFEECVGEECAAYYIYKTFYPETDKGGCSLCKKIFD